MQDIKKCNFLLYKGILKIGGRIGNLCNNEKDLDKYIERLEIYTSENKNIYLFY